MNYQIVILAAGKGTRMESNIPKALMPLGKSTMIETLLDNLGPDPKPIIVVGYKSELVKSSLKDRAIYAMQKEQLGTGHATQQAMKLLDKKSEVVIVLNGDQPFADKEMIERLIAAYERSDDVITMGIVSVPSFSDWYGSFERWGRVSRDKEGYVKEIVEYKDANDSQRAITEVNPTYFVIERDWLEENLLNIDNDNSQEEYYLTDLIELAFKQGRKINSIEIKPQKALAANTKEQLEVLERFVKTSE